MDNSEIIQNIRKNNEKLSKSHRLIADYICSNYDTVAFCTASQLGKAVGVSEATVIRFAYAMGYDGYPELQQALQNMIKTKLTTVERMRLSSEINKNDTLINTLKADMDNIRQTIDGIDEETFENAVEAIIKAKTVYIIGLRNSSLLSQFLYYNFGFIRENVKLVNDVVGDVYEAIIPITSNDVCIGISFPRYSNRTLNAVKIANQQNAKIIALTDSKESPIAKHANYVLAAKSDMVSFTDSLVAPLSVINALIIAVSMRCRNEMYDKMNKLETIWESENTYFERNEDE